MGVDGGAGRPVRLYGGSRRTGGDFRANEIDRALDSAEALAQRFPNNPEIRKALGQLRYAKEAHSRLKARRGGNFRTRPQRSGD